MKGEICDIVETIICLNPRVKSEDIVKVIGDKSIQNEVDYILMTFKKGIPSEK